MQFKYLLEKYNVLNIEFVKRFYMYKEKKDQNIHTKYSQFTIDHVNWMIILFYRWLEIKKVLIEDK